MNTLFKYVSAASVVLVAFAASAQGQPLDRPGGHQGRDVSPEVAERQVGELRAAATGRTFRIGRTQYRVVPDATVTPVERGATVADDGTRLMMGRHAVSLSQGGEAERAGARPEGGQALVVAVSETGASLILSPSVVVFFDDPAAVERAASRTGGRVIGTSGTAGRGFIQYDNVDQALQAMERIQGEAGIRGVEPSPVSQDSVE